MKKALLIMLLFLLPWQAIAAAERSFAHVMSSRTGSDLQYVAKHMAEHDTHVLHHHDDDDDDRDAHVDKSEKSVRHLNDYDQGCCLHALLPAPPLLLSAIVLPSLAPDACGHTFSDRTTLPPLPPPRARA